MHQAKAGASCVDRVGHAAALPSSWPAARGFSGSKFCGVVRRCPPRGYRHSCQTIDRHAAGRAANPVVLLAARVSLSQLRILAVDRGRQRASVRPNSWRLLSLVRLRWCVVRVLFIFEVTDSSLLVLKPTTRLLVRSERSDPQLGWEVAAEPPARRSRPSLSPRDFFLFAARVSPHEPTAVRSSPDGRYHATS